MKKYSAVILVFLFIFATVSSRAKSDIEIQQESYKTMNNRLIAHESIDTMSTDKPSTTTTTTTQTTPTNTGGTTHIPDKHNTHQQNKHKEDDDCLTTKKQQSPIDIRTKKAQICHKAVLKPRYKKAVKGNFKFNGHTWQLNVKNPEDFPLFYRDAVTGKAYNYNLAQLHTHIGSEHHMNGEKKDLEVHFVHTLNTKSLKGLDVNYKFKYLVIGLFANINPKRKTSRPFRNLLVDRKSTFRFINHVVRRRKLFHYRGSLTTPNYDESVNWFVASKTYRVRPSLLKKFNIVLKEKTGKPYNKRKICPLRNRKIWKLYGI